MQVFIKLLKNNRQRRNWPQMHMAGLSCQMVAVGRHVSVNSVLINHSKQSAALGGSA